MMSVTLNSGAKMPLVGFGAWKVNKDTCADTIYNAIKTGYRLIDGAADYGNERECGQGVNRAIEDGIVTRQELFITSKLWNSYHAPENVFPAFQKSLKDWNLDYIDLYLIHFPIAQKFVPFEECYPPTFYCGEKDGPMIFEDVPIADTWKAMEEIYHQGLAKSIGISNFCGALIVDLLRSAKVKPAVLQIEHHPYLQQPDLIEFCQNSGIMVTGYSTFGPQSFLELNHNGALAMESLLEHKVIKEIAQELGKTPGQVLLRWATQRKIAVIPKSNNKDRLKQNLECLDFDLSEKHLESIRALDKNYRFNDPYTWPGKIPIFA